MAKKQRKPTVDEIRSKIELLACGARGCQVQECDDGSLAWVMGLTSWQQWLSAIRATYFQKHTPNGTIINPKYDCDYVFGLASLDKFGTFQEAAEFIREHLPTEWPEETNP